MAIANRSQSSAPISHLLDYTTVQVAAILCTLDGLASAVILTDERARVVYANPAGQNLLAQRAIVHTVNGPLSAGDRAATRQLHAAIKQAANDEVVLTRKGIGIGVRSPSGDPVVIHLLPLGRGQLRDSIPHGAVAALFISTLTEGRTATSPDALTSLYDLTPAELRVLELVGQGLTPTEVSSRVGVGLATVRTHLSQLFAKTGQRRQADLVRLVHSLRPPI